MGSWGRKQAALCLSLSLFFFPHFGLPGFHCLFLICLCALGQLDSCRRFSPFMINEVAIAVISPTSWMWAGNSRGGKIPLRTPTNPAWRYSTLAFYFFFLFFFFLPAQMGKGAAMQTTLSVFLRGRSATFYGKVGFPPLCPHWLPDTGRALCGCVCGEQTLLIPESRAGREAGLRSPWASTAETGRRSDPAAVRTAFLPFLWRRCAAILVFCWSVAVPGVV